MGKYFRLDERCSEHPVRSLAAAIVARPVRLAAQIPFGEQTVPADIADRSPWPAPVRIDSVPDLAGRLAMQVLVRSDGVVPEPELAQQSVQFTAVLRREQIEF